MNLKGIEYKTEIVDTGTEFKMPDIMNSNKIPLSTIMGAMKLV